MLIVMLLVVGAVAELSIREEVLKELRRED